YYEEPHFGASKSEVAVRTEGNVRIASPHVAGGPGAATLPIQRQLLDGFLARQDARDALLWYYTPLALEFSRHLDAPRVYDCMDELSAFKGAADTTAGLERELLSESVLVFTGGRSLYQAKRRLHPNVYCFPSAVDARHFAPASRAEPPELR